jgi:hypothetical protein
MPAQHRMIEAFHSNAHGEKQPTPDVIGTPYALHGREQTSCSKPPPKCATRTQGAEMKTLIIKDLPVTEELDSRAMSAVRGGSATLFPGYISMNGATLSMPFNPQQIINQTQTTFNQNGSNIAFAEALKSQSTVAPTQDAKNIANVNFGVAGNLA